ncbi:trifunctional dihydropteroate synthetase [Ciborinia camelliae]|nr:trifunctional dihydropteroate synthetase [Ciborinia camelliae]
MRLKLRYLQASEKLQARENSTSMRGFLFPSVVKRGVILPRSFIKTPFHGFSKCKNPTTLISRSYVSDNTSSSPSPWTQHPLNTNQPSSNDVTTLSKPQAQPQLAYIALGSNLGDRVAWIEMACNKMSERGIKVKRTSGLWETEPMYVLDQANFLNGACEVETTLEPLALLDELQSIENEMGREKIIDKGPRNIDLDILLYGNEVVDHPRLQIPHPGMVEREFVLRPLAELIPGQPLNPKSPWKLTQDYLNALPPSPTPLSTLTPLNSSMGPLHALKPNRQTNVMAILNVTPDSFSDGGKNRNDRKFLRRKSSELVKQGATIIDVGGQSTAPNAPEVSPEVELQRIIPAIEEIRRSKSCENIAISIDTYRASVAKAAVEAGADIINDVSSGQMDPNMLRTMAQLGKTVCLMHMRGTPSTMNNLTDYSPTGLIPTIARELLARVAEAEAAGIRRWRIILDPGIGFAKSQPQNLEILRRLQELRDWPGLTGLPWLLGSSRKKFIANITDVTDPLERDWGTTATVTAAIQGGADVVRIHNVEKMVRVVRMSDAIYRV